MPKIPDEEIQRLKREVSLVRLCERYGIDLKPQGKNGVDSGRSICNDLNKAVLPKSTIVGRTI